MIETHVYYFVLRLTVFVQLFKFLGICSIHNFCQVLCPTWIRHYKKRAKQPLQEVKKFTLMIEKTRKNNGDIKMETDCEVEIFLEAVSIYFEASILLGEVTDNNIQEKRVQQTLHSKIVFHVLRSKSQITGKHVYWPQASESFLQTLCEVWTNSMAYVILNC